MSTLPPPPRTCLPSLKTRNNKALKQNKSSIAQAIELFILFQCRLLQMQENNR